MSRRLFYILDGYALAYRNFFANQGKGRAPMTNRAGEPTGAVYGFTRSLMEIIEQEKPYYMAVALDDGHSGRDTLYAGYKSTRAEMPADLATQLVRIRQMVEAFNIPVLTLPGFEADDLIGTAAQQAIAQDPDVEVRIFTGDRDLLQLITERIYVRLFIPMAKVPDEIYDEDRFRERFQFAPLQLIDYKALVGDTSDNIPGVAGIGDKTATDLILRYGSLDAVYANLTELKPKQQTLLTTGRESAYLSQQLATIRHDMAITIDLAACITHEFDVEKVEALFEELEFRSLQKPLLRIAAGAQASGAANGFEEAGGQLTLFDLPGAPMMPMQAVPIVRAAFPITLVNDDASLAALVDALKTATRIAIDTETTALDPMLADLVGISLSIDGESGYYLPVGHREGEQLPAEEVVSALRPAFADPAIEKYMHNATYDLHVLHHAGLDVSPMTCDTMIAAWMRDPLVPMSSLGLKKLSPRELAIDMTDISDLIGTGKAQLSFDQVPIAQAVAYAGADAVVTHKLADKFRGELAQRGENDPDIDPLWGVPLRPLINLFDEIEMPLVPVIASMERAGVMLDVPYLAEMSVRITKLLGGLERDIHELGGGAPFNINSPKQLNDVLFDRLKLRSEGVRRTSHGVSTAADVLENMRDAHPIVGKILDYRELSKLKGTYVDALPALINPRTGRVHTRLNQTGSSTGRLSSSNPNLQNIPIRTEIGREVRRAFITPPGTQLISVDYSQVELRILAHVTQEPSLLEAFRRGEDIHAATAAVVNNVPIESVTKTMRIFAKRVNFGLLYGMGAFRLARDSDLTLGEANAFINTYWERLPRIRAYHVQAKELARTQGFLTTLFGRRRTFPALTNLGARRNEVQAAEREAINMPIQGTAADLIKKAMIELFHAIKAEGLHARMTLQVHDELVLEAPEAEVEQTARLVREVMERAYPLDAPLVANAAAGDNWRDVVTVG